LFLSSKSDSEPQTQQHFSSYKTRSLYENNDHEWNIDDDIQPLNTTDTDLPDDRHRYANDDEIEENYLTAYHQLLQAHHQQQQQQQLMSQQEQENMLSTIFEASCEEATPMTSLVDVHQQRPQGSPTPVNNHVRQEEESEEEEEEQENEYQMNHPDYQTIDDIPVSTAFSKNESMMKGFFGKNHNQFSYLDLKYSEYITQKLQTEVNKLFVILFKKKPIVQKTNE